MAHRTLYVTYFGSYMIAIGNCIRAIIDYYDCDCDALKIIARLIVVYLVLLFAEPLLIRQNRIRAYIYMRGVHNVMRA